MLYRVRGEHDHATPPGLEMFILGQRLDVHGDRLPWWRGEGGGAGDG